MTAPSSVDVLSTEIFQECYADSAWQECESILRRHGIDSPSRAVRNSGFPGVMYNLDPLAPEWPLISIARHIRFQSTHAVIGGYMVACALGWQTAIDTGRDRTTQRRYQLAAISELRYNNLLNPAWLEVFGAILGTFDPRPHELTLLRQQDYQRAALVNGASPTQEDANLRIRAILHSQGYCLTYDDHRTTAALAALIVGRNLVPYDDDRRVGYTFEALDTISHSSRPAHVAWSQVRKELF